MSLDPVVVQLIVAVLVNVPVWWSMRSASRKSSAEFEKLRAEAEEKKKSTVNDQKRLEQEMTERVLASSNAELDRQARRLSSLEEKLQHREDELSALHDTVDDQQDQISALTSMVRALLGQMAQANLTPQIDLQLFAQIESMSK